MDTVGARIRKLRRALDMTQTEFAERIGSVQNTVTGYENGRRNPSAPVVTLICREFNVNPQWLEHGEGDMFVERDNSHLIQLAADYGLNAEDIAAIKSFLELPPAARKAFVEWAEKLVAEARVKPIEQELDDEYRELEQLIDDTKKRLAELEALRAKRFSGSP